MPTENQIDTLRQLIQGTALVFIAEVFGAAAGFTTRFIAARHLNAAEYGVLIYGVSVLSLLTILVLLGLPEGLARQLPRSGDGARLFQSSIFTAVPLSVAVGILLILSSSNIADILSLPSFSSVLTVFALALPGNVFLRIVGGGLQGREDEKGYVLIHDFLYQGLITALVFFATAFKQGVVGLSLSWLGAILVAAGASLTYVRSRTSLLASRIATFQETYRLLRFSLPLMISGAVWTIMLQSDNLLLGYFLQASDVGIYDVTFTLIQPFLMIVGIFGFLFLPLFSKLDDENDEQSMQVTFRFVTKWMVFLSLPLYFSYLLFSEELLSLIFGSEYAAGHLVLIILANGLFIHVITGVNDYALIALGETDTILRGNIVALVANLCTNALLIPRLGILGAGIASAISFGLLYGYYALKLFQQTTIHPISASLLRPLVPSSLLYICIVSIFRTFTPWTWEFMILAAGVFLPLYAAILMRLGLNQSDTQVYQEILRSTRN